MRITVLGTVSPTPTAKEACPSYWVEHKDTGILLDCGPGSLTAFQKYVGDISKIQTVILSHLHYDHFSDFLALRYRRSGTISVYAPPEPSLEFSLLEYKDSVKSIKVTAGENLLLGDLKMSFYEGRHGIPSLALRIEGPEGTPCYTGDTSFSPSVADAARGADLLLAEASYPQEDSHLSQGHLTASEAARLALSAGAKKLLLTHFLPGYDRNSLLSEAVKICPQTFAAVPGAVHLIGK